MDTLLGPPGLPEPMLSSPWGKSPCPEPATLSSSLGRACWLSLSPREHPTFPLGFPGCSHPQHPSAGFQPGHDPGGILWTHHLELPQAQVQQLRPRQGPEGLHGAGDRQRPSVWAGDLGRVWQRGAVWAPRLGLRENSWNRACGGEGVTYAFWLKPISDSWSGGRCAGKTILSG